MHWANLDLSQPIVMGILNVTPDSFSDGGDYADLKAAIHQAEKICTSGAKILDIGGESTRPGAVPPDVETEIRRAVSVIAAVRDTARECGVQISIDTRRAAVMQAAMEAGANIINDVSALAFDANALALAAKNQWPVILNHMRGTPQTMQDLATYQNVAQDVRDELQERIHACLASGLRAENLCIDPGIGFAKTTAQSITLLQNLNILQSLGRPVLVGLSRKRFLGDITGTAHAKDRDPASLAAAMYAMERGAIIIRTHDAPAMVQAIKVWVALKQRD